MTMANPHQLGNRQRGEVLIEFVGGTRDGERQYAPVVVHAGESAPTAQAPAESRVFESGETYALRLLTGCAQRCEVDGLLVWHYDVERPVRRARPAGESDA